MRKAAVFLLGWIFCSMAFAATYSQRPEVNQFIQQMCTKHNFDQKKLETVFDQVRPNSKIINIMSAPHESLPWYRYRALFVKQERARLGAGFWRQHANRLAKAQEKYGVPAPIILAILGVETDYGQVLGSYRVIDALSTIAFYYPPRASYFKSELEQFLLLTRENDLNPLEVLGSYAGAIGQPQFMPSSYRHYSVDADNKGYSDLINDSNDAIMSVGNYFKEYGWQNGQPVAVRAQISGKNYHKLLSQPKTKWTMAELQKFGVTSSRPIDANQRAALLRLEGVNAPEYWLVFHNFDVIMRYNTSAHYAMAVNQLSDLISQDYENRKFD